MEPFDASSTPRDPTPESDAPPVERVEPAPAQPASRPDPPAAASERARSDDRENMLPRRGRRRLGLERLLVRLVATAGIIGIGVALGAILASSKTQGWIIGLVVALVTVILSAILWSSRQL